MYASLLPLTTVAAAGLETSDKKFGNHITAYGTYA